jgi:hypothetical protein
MNVDVTVAGYKLKEHADALVVKFQERGGPEVRVAPGPEISPWVVEVVDPREIDRARLLRHEIIGI